MNRLAKRHIMAGNSILLLVFAGLFMPALVIADAHPGLPGPGDIIPPFSLPSPSNPSYAAYLGLTGQARFEPAELGADLVVIEVFNVYCASCQFMRPYMNELFAKIRADEELKSRVKMLAVGAGNDHWDIGAEEKNYDFPIIPDDDYDFHKLVGQPPTPFLIFARPYGNGRLLVIDSHLGRLNDSDQLLAMVRHAYQTENSQLKIKPPMGEGDGKNIPDPVPPVSESQLMDKVKQSLSIGSEAPEDIVELPLSGWGRIFTVKSTESQKQLFARVVARRIPCGDCHNVFYVYSFDADGTFIRFVPISIFKYGNRPWNDADVSKIQQRLQDQSLSEGTHFDRKVDAVSSATISSELVFDSIDQTGQVIAALIGEGIIPAKDRDNHK